MSMFARNGNRSPVKKPDTPTKAVWAGQPHARALIFPAAKWDQDSVIKELAAFGVEAVIVGEVGDISLTDIQIVVVVHDYRGDRNRGIGHAARKAKIPIVFPHPRSAVDTIRRELKC